MAVSEDRVAVVIEDDDDIRQLLETTLRQGGFAVHAAANGHDGVELVRALRPVVTTLDISLPDIDGFEVARRVRTFSDAYIVMLTARAEEIDTLFGLDAGADDYLTKPFRPRELRARIEAMLRRPRQVARATDDPAPAAGVDAIAVAPAEPVVGAGDATAPAAPEPPADRSTAVRDDERPEDVFAHNGLVLDVAARLAELDGEPLHLTRSEFQITWALLAARGRVLSKTDLVHEIWADDYDAGVDVTEADRRAVEVHVANLRRKLREDAASPRFIQTVRGVGYRRTAAR